jgi:alkylation response protein AidB-like acyl-CoA dehydrogenase
MVAERAEEAEVARRLPPDVVHELAAAGLFALAVPRSLGGPECHPRLIVDAVETISAGDGAAGWCVMIGSTSSVLAAYLPQAEAALIYGSPGVITGGAFAPSGRAVVVDGGHSVTGRWAWASGCQHCDWLVGGCRLAADDPDVTLCFFPADEVEIIDTWHTSGLRGTGSHDIAVEGVLVPTGRSVSLFSGEPVEDGPLYRFPVFGLLALGIAAVALGIARGAVGDLRDLAAAKTATFQSRALRERPVVQSAFAQAEADLAAARALVATTIDRVWRRAEGGVIADEERTALRLAATHATVAGARVVDRMYELGGGTSVRNENALQRRFRDVHAATQHVLVAPPTWEVAGRSLLGLAPGSPGW